MPRDKVALLINSCAKKPKPRRVTPSAPRPAQRSEHIDDALMATKRRRVAFGDVSIHVFPIAAPALATMDGSLHALPSKPAPGLDDMDGSLYNLRAFG